METVKEAKEFLKQNWIKGTRCPCCKQYVKLYKRRIDAGMARGLIEAYKLGGAYDYIHTPTALMGVQINTSVAQFSKLRYWGLVEEQINEDTRKRCSGYWKITQKGVDFLTGKIELPKYVYTYNQKLVTIEETEIEYANIRECLGEYFDYEKIMSSFKVNEAGQVEMFS